jgi:long-chain acyl-CoA synthetase
MALIERFEPASALESVQSNKCTVLYGAPPMFVAWAQMPNIRDYDLSSVRYIASGAAALPVKIMELFEGMASVPISEGYGLTEASPVVSSNAAGPVTKPGTVGKPIPGVEVRIVDAGGGEVARGELGELICRGENIMKGYWKQPEATAEALRDGWLYTGDLATVDEDGYFSIVDRKKDMIIVSGFNVYPNELENVISLCPGVVECAAIGVPDEKQGEAIKVFVVRKDPALTEEALMRYCHDQLTGYKRPKQIEFRDALPKTNVGKILRRELRAGAAA